MIRFLLADKNHVIQFGEDIFMKTVSPADHPSRQKKLIIHIGMNKTGTSSIQETLYNSSDYLKENGLAYPKNLHHHNITFYSLFLPDGQYSRLWRSRFIHEDNQREKDKYLGMWQRLFEKTNFACYIVSSEFLMNYSEGSLRKCAVFLKKYVQDIKVVAYVRHPDAYIISEVQQSAKRGGNDDDLSQRLKTSKNYYNTAFLQKWIREFGEDNVVVRPFEGKLFKNGDLIDDFFEAAGLDQIDTRELDKARTNEAIGMNAVKFLSQYNEIYPRFKNEKINRERAIVMEYSYQPFAKIADQKFDFELKYTSEEAARINGEIDYANTFLRKYNFQFDHVAGSNDISRLPDHREIDSVYYVHLVNEYNKYINEICGKNTRQSRELMQIHRSATYKLARLLSFIPRKTAAFIHSYQEYGLGYTLDKTKEKMSAWFIS